MHSKRSWCIEYGDHRVCAFYVGEIDIPCEECYTREVTESDAQQKEVTVSTIREISDETMLKSQECYYRVRTMQRNPEWAQENGYTCDAECRALAELYLALIGLGVIIRRANYGEEITRDTVRGAMSMFTEGVTE